MHDYTSIFGIAVGLAMDAFAVAIVSSIIIGNVSKRQYFRLGFHFGLFQALMPVLGWLAGSSISHIISSWDHWVAFFLLAAIGGKATYQGITQSDDNETKTSDPSKGIKMVGLSVAVSIDALAVGITFGVMKMAIITPAVIIGIVASLFTVTGIFLGKKLGKSFGKNMECFGGIILILIGFKILLQDVL